MKTETAEIVAFIAKNVRNIWPTIAKQDRLYIMSKDLIEYRDRNKFAHYITHDKSELSITTPQRDESIILAVDGDLSVCYIQENNDRERGSDSSKAPIHISLLKTE